MLDARTFSLLENRTPTGAMSGAYSLTEPRTPQGAIADRMSLFAETAQEGAPVTGDPATDAKTADALQWIAALSQLGGIVGQALAARKRKKPRSAGVAITPEARSTPIDSGAADYQQYLPGVTR